MRKAITLLLLGAMILGGSTSVLAETCSLDSEAYQEVVAIKDEFLHDLIEEGQIDNAHADYISDHFIDDTGQKELKDLGFSSWLKDQDYTDSLL